MKETIICTGQISREPYRFPETGICIYSYEELCYYLSSHMLCYIYTLPDESLLDYIKNNLKLDKLSRQLRRLTDPNRDQMKYFAALFREGEYFTEDDIRKILDDYRELKNTPYPMQCKGLGDMYLKSGRSSMAAFYYKEALKFGTLDQEEQGNVYHNMALAKARLFRFEDAKVDFLKAYQYGGVEDSLFSYYCIVAMIEGVSKADEEIASFEIQDVVMDSFENRYAGIRESFRHTGPVAWERRIRFLMEHGRQEEAEKSREQFAAVLKREFRKELYMDENLLVTNLPINSYDSRP